MRVVIVEDLALLREGIIALLRENGLEVVAQAEDGPGLQRIVAGHKPDVAIVDVRLPPSFTDEGLRAAIEARIVGHRPPLHAPRKSQTPPTVLPDRRPILSAQQDNDRQPHPSGVPCHAFARSPPPYPSPHWSAQAGSAPPMPPRRRATDRPARVRRMPVHDRTGRCPPRS